MCARGRVALQREALEARQPLRHVPFRNKSGGLTTVDSLTLHFALPQDPPFPQLRAQAPSPASWPRHPLMTLLLVCTEDLEDYRRTARPALRALCEAADVAG
ncbi:hypothetical protein H632_c4488p0, partial [Helicosporidium sp. ATCC 50920]